jgi:hypothetical protein
MSRGSRPISMLVGHAEDEAPLRLSRIEAPLLEQRRLDRAQRAADRPGERQGARGRPDAVGRADEQLVLEEPAQAAERVAHRRLADADALRGPGDAALGQEGVEGDQEVEVEPAQIGVVDEQDGPSIGHMEPSGASVGRKGGRSGPLG